MTSWSAAPASRDVPHSGSIRFAPRVALVTPREKRGADLEVRFAFSEVADGDLFPFDQALQLRQVQGHAVLTRR